jgi:hypothetical protein
MEHSGADINRKFVDGVNKITVHDKSGVSWTKFAYIRNIDEDADGLIKVQFNTFPYTGSWRSAFISLHTRPCEKLPRIEFTYWTPKSGLYYGIQEDGIYLVQRKVRRVYNVGLNTSGFSIRKLFANGSLSADSSSCTAVDIERPRVFQNSVALSESLYKNTSSVFFMGHRVGVLNEENKILLSDLDYIHFLPPEHQEICILNH